ncbi:hypothetical protein BC831DRAFT_474973 [Entophlyctis helioformis]|nr:hypothetical protein BC831DRAFT_474973 [Entophlyctis helioformis]
MTDRYAASSAKADPVVDDVDIRAIWQPSAAAAKAAASAAIAAAIAAATAATAAATRDHQEQYDQRLETSGSEAFNSDLARRLMQHGSFSPRLGRSSANATSHSTHAPMHINQPQHAQSNPPHFSTASQRVTQLASERKAASADSSIDDDEFQQIQEALELSLLEQHDYVLSHASLGHATQEAEATDSCTSLTSGNIQPCNAKLSGNGTGRAVRWSVDEPFVDPPLDAYDEDSALQLAIAMSIQECSHHADAGDDVGMQDAISAHDQGRSRMEPHQTAGYGEGHAQASQQQGQLAQDPLAPLDEEALREQRRRAKGKQRAE